MDSFSDFGGDQKDANQPGGRGVGEGAQAVVHLDDGPVRVKPVLVHALTELVHLIECQANLVLPEAELLG